MLPQNFVYLSFIPSTFGMFFLVRDIIRGKTKPNLVTWFLWSLAPLVGTFLALKAGAGLAALPVFLAGFFPAIIFILAIVKKDYRWRITSFDVICGLFSLFALIIYIFTRRTDISIIFAIISDGLAAVPTLVKAYKFPETETALGYLPGIINNSLGLLVIQKWTFSVYSFPIYFILVNLTLIFFILRKKIVK